MRGKEGGKEGGKRREEKYEIGVSKERRNGSVRNNEQDNKEKEREKKRWFQTRRCLAACSVSDDFIGDL